MKNTVKVIFILPFLLAVYSQQSQGGIWSWINKLTVCSAGRYCFDYDFTIADWDDDDNTANPCYRLSSCTLFISHRHNAAGTSGSIVNRSWSSSSYPFLVNQRTVGGVAKEFKRVFPLPYSSITSHSANTVATEECVGFFVAPGKNLGSNNSEINSSGFMGYSLMPGSICGTAPPPSGSCQFTVPTLTLDHGRLTRSELDGHEVSEDVMISCNRKQSLKIYIYSADKLNLRSDGSLYSQLFLNSTTLGNQGLSLDVLREGSVNVKSVLKTNGAVAPGEFSGSTIMLITID